MYSPLVARTRRSRALAIVLLLVLGALPALAEEPVSEEEDASFE